MNVFVDNGSSHPIPVDISAASYGNTPVSTTVVATSKVISAVPARLIHLMVTNTKNVAQFIQIFDAASLPAEGTVPLIAFKVPAQDGRSYEVASGLPFATGIVVCNSSTMATKTIGSADCLFVAIKK